MLRKHWPLFCSIAVLLGGVAAFVGISMARNDGQLIYALDDAYIHMAISKNLLHHGVWGVSPFEFASASSTLLWPVLLAGVYAVTGVNEIASLVMNVVFAAASLWCCHLILRRFGVPQWLNLLTQIAVIMLAPMFPVIFSGMEHMLHTFVAIAFTYLATKVLSAPAATVAERPAEYRRDLLLLIIASPLVAMARFEGVFMVAVVSILLFLRKRFKTGLLVGGIGAVPILAFAAISVALHWYPLPNSVLIKGNRPDLGSIKGLIRIFGGDGYLHLVGAQHMLMMVLACMVLFLLIYARERNFWREPLMMLAIVVMTSFLHMQFARIGWLYRYEAYLVVLGIVSFVAAGYPELRRMMAAKFSLPQTTALVILLLFLLVPFGERAVKSLGDTTEAMACIYRIQYTMGKFTGANYNGAIMVAHDIGAINYFADIHTVDLAGLATLDVVEAKRKNAFDTRKMAEIAKNHGATIGLALPTTFERWGGLPPEWIAVGRWETPGSNPVYGGNSVTFFAIDSSAVSDLAAKLKAFESRVPASVMQTGMYRDGVSGQ